MTPYYVDESVTLWHGDARDLLPRITGDVLITDPPYGVALGTSKEQRIGTGRLRKDGYAAYDDTYESFVETVVPALAAALAQVKRGAVFTGPHIHEQPKPDAIGGVFYAAGTGRNLWGFKTFLPVLLYGAHPRLHKGCKPTAIRSNVLAPKNGHPCPKPVEWMRWLIDFASLPGETVIDPFAGSGTTLVAAKQLGRRAVGVEIEERYCEIAAKRLAQGVLDFGEAS